MAPAQVTYRHAAGILGVALLLGACTVHKQETPSLTGPSELGTAITIAVSPDVLAQDGASQSQVTVTARDANGQPLRSLPLRAEIAVNGFVSDFGTLSARNVVTDASGRATFTYTAPAAAGVSIDTGTQVEIRVTPTGSDFGNATPRFATIRLVPTGVVTPPTNGLTPLFTATPATDHEAVIFDASQSTATGATIVSYRWNFGDGSTGSGITTQHTYNSPGSFPVTLTVVDSIGRTNSAQSTVTVAQGQLPTAVIVASPASPAVSQAVNFSASTSRPAPGRTIRSYDWNFGDGTSGSGAQVAHAYTAAGAYTVILTVTDDAGRIATATQTITVATGNPTADFTFSPSAPTTLTPVNFDGASSLGATGHTIVSYTWSFGDGASGSGATVSHRYTAAGTYVVRLTVTDDQGKTNFITKSVTVS